VLHESKPTPPAQDADETPHTLEHWLDCPGTVQARMEIYGTTQQLPLSTLTAFPDKSVALASRRTLWRPWCEHHIVNDITAASVAMVFDGLTLNGSGD